MNYFQTPYKPLAKFFIIFPLASITCTGFLFNKRHACKGIARLLSNQFTKCLHLFNRKTKQLAKVLHWFTCYYAIFHWDNICVTNQHEKDLLHFLLADLIKNIIQNTRNLLNQGRYDTLQAKVSPC